MNIEDECEYFIIYNEADKKTATPRQGKVNVDARDGIYHFMLGKDRGLIKNISFSRFDVQYAQEQLMTNQVGLYDELKMPYNANITMYGNNLLCGHQIYINPSSIGFGNPRDKSSPAFRLGLGGYYTVLGVTTTVVNGASETTLKCSFGSHASDSPGLSPPAQQTRRLGDMASTRTPEGDLPAPDPAPQPQHVGKNSIVHTSLRSLRGQNGESVVDPVTANLISHDYIRNPNDDAAAARTIPGVRERSSNPSGAKTYLLANGYKIEIDPSGQVSKASVVAGTGKTVEELAVEKSIGTDPARIYSDREQRQAQRTQYTPPERESKT